jgi:hypothetical protein
MSMGKQWVWVAAVAALAAGCGGGSGGIGSEPTTLAGKVIDGYIGGARVCLDINSNLQCDAGEPSAISAADGSYSLNYSGSVDGMQVLAVVEPGAVDSELGLITKAFDLLAPAENASVVTPLTTLVANEMTSRGINAADAEQAIKAQFNFSGDLLGQDFVAAGDTDTLKVAQVVAASIAAVKEELQTVARSDASVAALSQKDMLKAVMTEVKASVLPTVLTGDGKAAIDAAGLTQEALSERVKLDANVGAVLQGKVEQIVARSKAGDGTVLNMADVFKTGIVIAQESSGYAGNTFPGVAYSERLVAEWLQVDQDAGDPVTSTFVWMEGSWLRDLDSLVADSSWVSLGGDWFEGTTDIREGKPFFDGNCVVVPLRAGGKDGNKFCAVSRDVSGKKVKDFLKDVCLDDNNRAIAGCDPEQVWPNNSIGYDLTISSTSDIYEIWADGVDSEGEPWSGYRYKGKDEGQAPSINAFIEDTHAWGYEQWAGSGCSVGFHFKNYNPQTRTGDMVWARNRSGSCNNANVDVRGPVETTKFSVTTVGGQDVLRSTYSNVFRQANPGEGLGGEMIFAVANHGVTQRPGIYNGDFTKAGRSTTIPFTGSIEASFQVVNKTLFDAAMKVLGIAPYPYPGRT